MVKLIQSGACLFLALQPIVFLNLTIIFIQFPTSFLSLLHCQSVEPFSLGCLVYNSPVEISKEFKVYVL